MSQLLVQFRHLSHYFGSRPVFEDVSLSIHRGELYALVGENGAGKTTLLSLLAKERPGLRIGYLPQEIPIPDPMIRVRDVLEDSRLAELESRMSACLEAEKLAAWEELHRTYEELGGYQRIPVEQALVGLKIDRALLDAPFAELSSGQRTRVALAKALMENPDLLLLDEPTNHLDQEMLDWLKTTLQKREGATIFVSHDRKFINETCNRLLELKEGKLSSYAGNWDFYLAEQTRVRDRQMREYGEREEEKRLLKQKIKAATFAKAKAAPPTDRNIMAYDYRGSNHQKSLKRTLDQWKARLEEIEQNLQEMPNPKRILGLRFAESPLASSVAIELEGVSIAFGEKAVLSKFSATISRGERVILIGPNGAGKTTLLRAIAGELQPRSGTIRIAKGVKIGTLDQEALRLPMDQTPLTYFENRFQLTEEALRRELHKMAIGGDDLLKRPFSTLSTGQRKRFLLLSLILEKPNVLLLDEPTNHLDFLTLEALESALLHFDGAVLAVSHDRTFIEKIRTREISLDQTL